MGRSVRGASHTRSGLPNQDAIGWTELAGSAGSLLLAVADGHGSAKCFRSDYGSRFAVETAKAALTAPEQTDPTRLAEEVVSRWRVAVQNHLCEDPIPASAWLKLEKKLGKAARLSVEADPVLAYGSTLLAAVVSESVALYLRLGDGDILTVSGEAEVSRPWPRNEEQFGDETASLATRNAAREVQLRITRAPENLPALILLSTDGYANSFRDDGGFVAVGRDLLRMIHSEGIAPITENLECWLQEASELGSGDDITVGVLWRDGRAAEQT
jgi:serine/threonine protein phosphatase PrpC